MASYKELNYDISVQVSRKPVVTTIFFFFKRDAGFSITYSARLHGLRRVRRTNK